MMLAKSLQSAAGNAAAEANYIESVFQTHLYTGNGSTQTITNGIDLAGEGGLVWLKPRSLASSHILTDTVRGAAFPLIGTNTTAAQYSGNPYNFSFSGSGFAIASGSAQINQTGYTYASWTFRKQPKFFDVVTYTGTGSYLEVAHNLASVPGVVIIKKTSATGSWVTYARKSNGDYVNGYLNTTAALPLLWTNAETPSYLNDTTLKISYLQIASGDDLNSAGATYVAYLFAHNAGGFGLSGEDNVISCGSFTTDGSGNATVNLGYEPQWVLVKRSDGTGNWLLFDNMRGMPVGGADAILQPNTSGAETTPGDYLDPTATGFTTKNWTFLSASMIYIAIRRGPMKVPESGTSVFDPELTAAATGTTVTTNFPIDLQLYRATGVLDNTYVVDRLRGVNTTAVNTSTPRLFTSTTGAESTDAVTRAWDNTGFQTPLSNGGVSSIYWNFRRAPGFFDEVCYTASGSPTTINHNLAAVPEMIIVKRRNATYGWAVYTAATGKFAALALESASGSYGTFAWNDTLPTSSVFSIGSSGETNTSGGTYVAYLFASCPGVSKVFNYTGNGSSQTINCGFTGGARFVMIKRTDSTGNWMVVDTARGLVAAGDPTLYLNSTAAEVTGVDWIDPDSSGFIVNQEGTMNANVNGATYIGLAIA